MGSKTIIIIGIIIVGILFILFIGFRNKCGDGVCQKFEERRGSCLEDCGEEKQLVEIKATAKCSNQNGFICDTWEKCEGNFLNAIDTFTCCDKKCTPYIHEEINIEEFVPINSEPEIEIK